VSRRSLKMPSTRQSPDAGQQSLLDDEVDELAAVAPAAPRVGVVQDMVGMDTSSIVSVSSLPTPYDVADTVDGPLSDKERSDLEVCEQALHGFRKALIVAGKALEVINRGRLYRETHGRFEDYVVEVWGFKRAHAYRLIEEWPVAAACLPIGDINEQQARALLPVWKNHGPAATVALYREVRKLAGQSGKQRVAAADLAEAREVLPPRLVAPEQVSDVLRLAAAEGRMPRIIAPRVAPQPPEEVPEPADEVTQQGAEGIAVLEAAAAQQRQIYDRLAGAVQAALFYDPPRAEMLLRELRQYANRTAYRARDRDREGEQRPDPA